ncbi:hypothetical protein LCGC14_1474930 [marine sediment metagenome]|uniref:Uncharacterized protein n=1 Tax=marine sediment metagenome TaxID=412755 RepID=A0A0F9MCY3_9ZZZZ
MGESFNFKYSKIFFLEIIDGVKRKIKAEKYKKETKLIIITYKFSFTNMAK